MEEVYVNIDRKILNWLQKKSNIDNIIIKEKIRAIVEYACVKESINAKTIEIAISSMNKDEIQKINKEYRNVDKSTDVLSFPIYTKNEFDLIKTHESMPALALGDIILCLDIVEEHSKEYGTTLIREVLYMITHGVCHLLGYDHEVESDKVLMRSLEEDILKKIEVTNDEK